MTDSELLDSLKCWYTSLLYEYHCDTPEHLTRPFYRRIDPLFEKLNKDDLNGRLKTDEVEELAIHIEKFSEVMKARP